MVMKYYCCPRCGQTVEVVKQKNVPIMCCLEVMREMLPGASEASIEKHTPVIEMRDGTVIVTVGSVGHPMLQEHYIEWIAIQTKDGSQRKILNPGDMPKAIFALRTGDEVEAVYACCSLHGLWRTDSIKRNMKNWCRNRTKYIS